MDFFSIHVGNAVGRVMFNRLVAPMLGAPVDQNSLKFGLDMLDKYLPFTNDLLRKSKYIAGDELTIADFSLLATLDPLEMLQVSPAAYKN